jgi:hypothetical protein
MREIFARFALDWLQHKLWPLALEGAGLPPDTSLEQLKALKLPEVDSDEFADYANAEATTLCTQLPLFCAVMLAVELAQSEAARQMAHCLYGLMWRDAAEFAIARDLDMACNLDGLLSQDFADRCLLAAATWERWKSTSPAVQATQEDFLSDCAEQSIWEKDPVWYSAKA